MLVNDILTSDLQNTHVTSLPSHRSTNSDHQCKHHELRSLETLVLGIGNSRSTKGEKRSTEELSDGSLPVGTEVGSRVGGEDTSRVVTLRRQDRTTRNSKLRVPSLDGRSVLQVYQSSTNEGTEELSDHLSRKLSPLLLGRADNGRGESDGRVHGGADIAGESDSRCPGQVDGKEVGVVKVCKNSLGNNTVTDKNEQKSANEFREIRAKTATVQAGWNTDGHDVV